MDSEKYNKIIKCTLRGKSCNYVESYVLVKDIKDLDSELNVDLKGLCFNTDYEITDIEDIREIESLDELYEFCKNKEIWIDDRNITENGLLVGADSCFLIMKNLIPYGWISEDYISNNEEKKKILDNISKEISEENIEEESI